MSVGPIVATPQLHTAYDLKRVLDADNADRNIACTVEVDVWSPEAFPRGGPRVTIELGDGAITEAAAMHYQPGAWWPVSPQAASLSAPTFALSPSSTIAPSLSGTPLTSANALVTFSVGGTLGTGGIVYSVSYDGGATASDPVDLGLSVSVAIFGVVLSLGSAAALVSAGDSIAWTQRRATHDVARPFLDDAQVYRLSIHVPARANVAEANRAASAQDATDQLMRSTMAAIRRQLHAPFRAVARLTWPKKIVGYPDFVYGSLCVVEITIGSPILDDSVARGRAIQIGLTGSVGFSDGTTSPPTSATAQG